VRRKKMARKNKTVLAACLLFLAGAVIAGETAKEIIRRVDEKASVTTSRTVLSMLIYPDRAGTEHRTFKLLAYGRGENESYMEFLEPKSIKGLKLLSLGDDQWIYFASTGRRRKIATSARAKKQPVQGVGGDFSYEDLGGGSLGEKYSFTVLEDGKREWTLEGAPRKDDSVYSRIIVTVDKARYLTSKIEYYTEEEGHYKDLVLEDVTMLGGRETAAKMTMLNHDRGSKTVVLVHEASYDLLLEEKYFNPARFFK
jgi:outer membrane lipoprotein-sorting protein